MSERNIHLPQSPLVEKGLAKFRSFIAHQFVEQTLWAFAELGLADLLLNESLTAVQISETAGKWNAQLLYRLLRTSLEVDLVTADIKENVEFPETMIRFSLTETGRLLLSNDSSHARDMIRFGLSPFCKKASFYLPELIREGYTKGTGAEQVYGGGRSVFEYLSEKEQGELSSTFNGTMSAYSSVCSNDIASTIDFSAFQTLADIGGSLGTLLATILQRYQSLKGILCDLAEVINQAKKKNVFEEMNIPGNRYEFHPCNVFDCSTIPVCDAYILKQVLHDFNDETSIEILRSIGRAASANERKVTLYIVEVVILPEKEAFSNWIPHGMDIYMLYFLGSQERTLEQYQSLLEKAAFTFVNIYRLPGPESVIQAILN